jgi:hypothetical protein
MGLSTDFDVNVVVKGDKDLKHIVLHHYRFANAKDRLIPDAPELVSFAPSKTKSWLLFLQKEADGRYAPINGQVDPAECAVSPADSIDLVVIVMREHGLVFPRPCIWSDTGRSSRCKTC